MDPSLLDDVALLALIASAHGGFVVENSPAHIALGVLYDRYGRLVFTIAVRTVGDQETAEEITQDVFMRVWEGARTYQADMAKVSSWLISIARYRSIDELRRRGARPESQSADWPDEGELVDGLPAQDGPEEEVSETILRRAIRQAVFQLPPEQREVLRLAFFKGLSHSQIANQLGQPLGTVKSRVRLAMQRLRVILVEKKVVED